MIEARTAAQTRWLLLGLLLAGIALLGTGSESWAQDGPAAAVPLEAGSDAGIGLFAEQAGAAETDALSPALKLATAGFAGLFFGDRHLEWVLGALFVLIYAHRRFNTPKQVATQTTRFRFHFSGLSYYTSSLVLFVMIANVIHLSPELLSALFPDPTAAPGGGLSEDVKNLSAPLLSAVILTAFLPHSPLLSQIDDAILGFFRRIGRIPIAAVVLGTQLRRSDLAIPEVSHRLSYDRTMKSEPAIKLFVQKQLKGITPDDLQFERSDSVAYRTTAMIWLMMEVNTWAAARNYRSFFDSVETERQEISRDFEKLISLFSQYNHLKHQYENSEKEALKPTLDHSIQNFSELHDDLKRKICDLIARAVLSQEYTSSDRQFRIEQIGFALPRAPFDLDHFLSLTVVFFIVMLAGISLAGSDSFQEETVDRLMRASMVAIIFGSAVVCAVLPKAKFGFANILRKRSRPYSGYLFSGLLAVACGAMISITFKTFWFRSLRSALNDMELNYPWLILTFTMAVTVAYLADNFVLPRRPSVSARRFVRWVLGLVHRDSKDAWIISRIGESSAQAVVRFFFDRSKVAALNPPVWISVLEGLLAAAVLSSVAFMIVYPMLEETGAPFTTQPSDLDKRYLVTVISAVLGLLAGGTVPRLRRRVLLEQRQEQEQKTAGTHRSRDISRIIKGLYFFDTLEDGEIEQIIASSSVHFYPSNTPVIENGGQNDTVFVVLSGTLKAEIQQRASQKVTIGTFESGDSFGEISLMTGERTPANVFTLSTSELMKIRKDTWSAIFGARPGAMESVARALAIRKSAHATLSVMIPRSSATTGIDKQAEIILRSMKRIFGVSARQPEAAKRPDLKVASSSDVKAVEPGDGQAGHEGHGETSPSAEKA